MEHRAVAAHLDISDVTLRLALTYVLESAGHVRARSVEDADVLVVDDHVLASSSSAVGVVVVEPVPAACQLAVDALMSGRARTAICSDDPEALLWALRASTRSTVALPSRIVTEANRAPRLPCRLATTLHLVLTGCSNQSIARQLHQSESTVKRDINSLLRRFEASNRIALIGAARTAGFSRHAGARAPARRSG